MMKIIILVKTFHNILYFDPLSFFRYFWYNIKQKCIFKSLLLGVLCANFAHFLSPGEFFLRGSYLKPERSWNISQKMFSLVPGDVKTFLLTFLIMFRSILHCCLHKWRHCIVFIFKFYWKIVSSLPFE